MEYILGARRRARWVLPAVCMSVVIVSLDTTVVNIALAPIYREMGATTTQLQWVSDAYLVVYAGLLLLAGAIGDRIGHRRLLIGGLIIFGAGSALASVSGSAGALIAWRAFMGVGAAAIMPASLSVLTSVFTGKRRAAALGFWSAAAGAGVAAGPLIGGALLAEWSWRSVFWINVPLAGIAVAADAWALPATTRRRQPLDLAGAALATAAIVCVTAAVIESPAWGWVSARTGLLYAVSALAAAGFAARQRQAEVALIELAWFTDRRLSVPCVVAGGLFFAMTGASFVLMLYLQLILGYSPLIAGTAILPAVALTMVTAPLAGTLVATAGARALMAAGMALLAAGLAWFATLTAHSAYWPRIFPAGALFGIGVGLALTPASDAVMGSAAGRRPGAASGIIETVEEIASALGIAVTGAIVTSRFTAALTGQPPQVTRQAGSLPAALTAAQHYGPAHIRAVAAAFAHAMDAGLWATAAVAAVTALAALAQPAASQNGSLGGSACASPRRPGS